MPIGVVGAYKDAEKQYRHKRIVKYALIGLVVFAVVMSNLGR